MSEIKKSDDQSSAKFLYFTCKNCGKEKSHTEFYKNSRSAHGYNIAKCKNCISTYNKEKSKKITEAKKENKNQMKSLKELQSIIQSISDFDIYVDDEDLYEKFVTLSESALERAKYLRDANRKDTLSIKILSQSDINDLIEFQIRTSITNIVSSYLNEHTNLDNVMPNDVHYKSVIPNIMIFTYHNINYKYQINDIESIKKDIIDKDMDGLIKDIM